MDSISNWFNFEKTSDEVEILISYDHVTSLDDHVTKAYDQMQVLGEPQFCVKKLF